MFLFVLMIILDSPGLVSSGRSQIPLKYSRISVKDCKGRKEVKLSESDVIMEMNLKMLDLLSFAFQKGLVMNFLHLLPLSRME